MKPERSIMGKDKPNQGGLKGDLFAIILIAVMGTLYIFIFILNMIGAGYLFRKLKGRN